jgi:hypothetical protein
MAKTFKTIKKVPISGFVLSSFGNVLCKALCPYCKEPHFHGFGDGHRVADCKDGNINKGYDLTGTMTLFKLVEKEIKKMTKG